MPVETVGKVSEEMKPKHERLYCDPPVKGNLLLVWRVQHDLVAFLFFVHFVTFWPHFQNGVHASVEEASSVFSTCAMQERKTP